MKTELFLNITLKLLLSLVFLNCSIGFGQSTTQTDNPDNQYWDDQFGIVGTNGDIHALRLHGNDLYVGGDFRIAGNVIANGIVKWDGDSWYGLGAGIDENSSIFALEIIGDDLYVGGKFQEISGLKANNIAKFNLVTKTWSTVGAGEKNGVNNTVKALAATDDGDLYIGGEFTSAGDSPTGSANYIVIWDGEGWYTLGKGLSYFVNAIAIHGKSVYVGGKFRKLENTQGYIAKWDIESNNWVPMGQSFNSLSHEVYSVGVSENGMVAIGGNFSLQTSGRGIGIYVSNFAIWDGKQWLPTGKEGTGGAPLKAIAFKGDDIYVSKRKWNGRQLESLRGWEYGHVNAIAVSQDGEIYFAGSFEDANGIIMNNITLWDGNQFHPFNKGKANGLVEGYNRGSVRDIIANKNTLYAVGEFTFSSGNKLNNIAAWSGEKWISLQNGIKGAIITLATDIEGNLYVGGRFKEIEGVQMNGFAKWDGDNWQSFGQGENSGVNGNVMAIVVDNDGIVYAGGSFGSAGGAITNNIAKWRPEKKRWVSLGGGINGSVSAMDIDKNGNLYVGGKFNKAGDISANNIAKWDGNSWTYLGTDSLNNGVEGTVSSIAVNGDDVYIGGNFYKAGNETISNIAKWNNSTGNWIPLGKGLNSTVSDILIVQNDNLYVAGSFIGSGEQTLNRIAKWDGSQWHPLGTGIEEQHGRISSIVLFGNNLYVGGYFSIIGDKASFNIAKWSIISNSN